MIAGIGGGTRNGAVALTDAAQLLGVCAQERVTRVRGAGLNTNGLPDEALDLMLERSGRRRSDLGRRVAVGGDRPPSAMVEYIDHHLGHASTTYLTSGYSSAVVVVCDHQAPEVSIWIGNGASLQRQPWPWTGPGFASALSRCSNALGFTLAAADQRSEALARLRPESRDAKVDALIRSTGESLLIDAGLESFIATRLDGAPTGGRVHADLAAALEARLGDLFLELLRAVRQRFDQSRLCLGGSLFYNSSLNTRIRQASVFDDVFVPVDPGDSGLAVGAALHASGALPSRVSPFVGPCYTSEETKQVLDNCKLSYAWESDEDAIGVAVQALREGRLVGWFDGGMEWGPRALGGRCILANPAAPYVLDNLNRFLKRRDPWRGYALSGLAESVAQYFSGPAAAPFMECNFRPRDAGTFREALPSTDAAVRIHTVSADSPLPRFRRLIEAFGEATGLPFLINTSFNGFHEPIVCGPRDAVRVFYGTGLDVLVVNQFVLRK